MLARFPSVAATKGFDPVALANERAAVACKYAEGASQALAAVLA
jgi:hypothetical protein